MSLHRTNEIRDFHSEKDVILKVAESRDTLTRKGRTAVMRAHEFSEICGGDLYHALQESPFIRSGSCELPDRFPLFVAFPPIGEIEEIDAK